MNAAASRLKRSAKSIKIFLSYFQTPPLAPHSPGKTVEETPTKPERKKNFLILSFEGLPLTSMNAAARRLERSAKSFNIFLSYFRTPPLPCIALGKRFRKLEPNRKEKRIFLF